ncbi:MAG: hypothetical protein FWC28_05905 [Proteobacteria bacterium]|nr:hypothetical protein [Cystobacterineae bacterium]MCL2314766.1 hypothetical protein [Pseudomonadota bacterium]
MGQNEKLRRLANCLVTIDGREISDLYPWLKQVSVETSRKDAAICTLKFISVRNEHGEWNVQDADVLVPWRRILIEAVFGTESEEIMRGFIRDIRVEYSDDMNVSVTVTGQDESILLDREHVQKTYSTFEQPLMDDALIRELLKPHWVGSQIEVSAGTTCGNLYFDGRPIRLIRDRAALNGYEFWVRKGKAYFGPPDLEGDPQPGILFYVGPTSNCFKFSVFHDGHRPDSVCFVDAPESSSEVGGGETYSNQSLPLGETLANSKNQGLGDFVWRIQTPRGSTLAEREARAKAKAEEVAWKIRATGELDGSIYGHVLQPNRTVKVDGVGRTHAGIWYVDEVKHHFSADGYCQAFRLMRNATGEMDSMGKADALAGVRLK